MDQRTRAESTAIAAEPVIYTRILISKHGKNTDRYDKFLDISYDPQNTISTDGIDNINMINYDCGDFSTS
jgi:hypothetical protein